MKLSAAFPASRLRRILRFSACALLAGLVLSSPMSSMAQAFDGTPVASRIIAAINPYQRVTLRGNTPAIAQAQYDQGALSDDTPVNNVVLVLKRSDEQETALKQLLGQMHSAGSPSFHQWLTPQEFAKRFGPSDADMAKITSWLQQNGFTVNKVSAGRTAIVFSGTTGQIQSAFHTQLHTYTRKGVTFDSNDQDPQIPAALAPVVSGLESLNDIKPASNMTVKGTAKFNMQNHTAVPNWNYEAHCFNPATGQLGPCTLYVPGPADLAVQYNLTSVQKAGTTGTGTTVGVISDSNLDLGVIQNYRTLFGLDPTNLPQVIVDGSDPGQNGAVTEAYLDVEAIAAMAPDVTTDVYVSSDTITTSGLVTAIVRAVDDDQADILTLSYGECEQQLGPSGNQFFYQAWEQAAAQGQSVFVSSGDDGSAGCDDFDTEAFATAGLAVSGFSSTPYNTSVGGTDFYYADYAQGFNGTGLQAELKAAWSGGTPSITPSASLTAPLAEQPWNQAFGLDVSNDGLGSSIVASSGGASTCVTGSDVDPTTGGYGLCTGGYAKPAWQTGPGVPTDGVRDLPDVSLFASNGPNLAFWPICASVYDCRTDLTLPPYSVSVTAIGGTSASSPAMAGIMALVDQSQQGRQGNANYELYALANQYPDSFNDVTIGSNNVSCTSGSPNCSLDTNGDGFYSLQHYATGPGYDEASGLGTINGANLIANWSKVSLNAAPKASATTLTLSQTTFAHGTPVTLSTTVTSAGGTPSGLVAILSSSSIGGQTGQGTVPLSDGAGTKSIDYLPGGTYNLTAEYAGDGTFGSSVSKPVSVTVSAESSTVTLSGQAQDTNGKSTTVTNGMSLPYSDTLYIEAQIAGKSGAGIASGQVTFMDGQTVLGKANVGAGNTALLTIGTLAPGAHNITATYNGDASFNASTSGPLTLTTTKGVVQVDLLYYPFASYTPTFTLYVYAGQPVTVTLDIDGGYYSAAPGGTATVSFGSLPPQTVTLSPSFFAAPIGTATVTFLPKTTGTYVLSATYAGDANYGGAVDPYPATVQVVDPTLAPSTTTLTTSTTTVGPDGIITVNTSVTGSINGVVPTGNVSVDLRGAEYSTALDSNGNATFSIAGYALNPGANTVFAQYPGDAHYASSQSAPITISANQGDFSLTTDSPTPSLPSGGTTTAQLTMAQLTSAQQGGLTGAVNLTCTSPSSALTCTLGSATVNLPANFAEVNTTVTLTSNAALSATTRRSHPGRRGLLGSAISLAMLFCFLSPTRRRKVGTLLSLILLISVGFGLVGCGGNSGSTKSTPTPAPTIAAAPVSYNVSILANASGVQHSLVLKVTVQ